MLYSKEGVSDWVLQSLSPSVNVFKHVYHKQNVAIQRMALPHTSQLFLFLCFPRTTHSSHDFTNAKPSLNNKVIPHYKCTVHTQRSQPEPTVVERTQK